MNQLIMLLACVCLVLPGADIRARRKPPAAVQHAELEYRVNHRFQGWVEACDIATKRQIWFRQIHVVQHDPTLEGDVQDLFITRTVCMVKT